MIGTSMKMVSNLKTKEEAIVKSLNPLILTTAFSIKVVSKNWTSPKESRAGPLNRRNYIWHSYTLIHWWWKGKKARLYLARTHWIQNESFTIYASFLPNGIRTSNLLSKERQPPNCHFLRSCKIDRLFCTSAVMDLFMKRQEESLFSSSPSKAKTKKGFWSPSMKIA